MSGGHFEYMQYRIREIADTLDVDINGRELDEDSLEELECEYKRGWIEKDYYEYCKEHKHTPPCTWYKPETIAQYKRGYILLRLAEIYAQRIDWLESCDDGEDSFHERLAEDLEELEKELSGKYPGLSEVLK